MTYFFVNEDDKRRFIKYVTPNLVLRQKRIKNQTLSFTKTIRCLDDVLNELFPEVLQKIICSYNDTNYVIKYDMVYRNQPKHKLVEYLFTFSNDELDMKYELLIKHHNDNHKFELINKNRDKEKNKIMTEYVVDVNDSFLYSLYPISDSLLLFDYYINNFNQKNDYIDKKMITCDYNNSPASFKLLKDMNMLPFNIPFGKQLIYKHHEQKSVYVVRVIHDCKKLKHTIIIIKMIIDIIKKIVHHLIKN